MSIILKFCADLLGVGVGREKKKKKVGFRKLNS